MAGCCSCPAMLHNSSGNAARRLRVVIVNPAARSVKEVNTAAVERSWREAFAAAAPDQVPAQACEICLRSSPARV